MSIVRLVEGAETALAPCFEERPQLVGGVSLRPAHKPLRYSSYGVRTKISTAVEKLATYPTLSLSTRKRALKKVLPPAVLRDSLSCIIDSVLAGSADDLSGRGIPVKKMLEEGG